jgi:hypothetical protein
MSVEELESAVARLSASELARFSEWVANFAADRWDHQIEEDLRAGSLAPPSSVPMIITRQDVHAHRLIFTVTRLNVQRTNDVGGLGWV